VQCAECEEFESLKSAKIPSFSGSASVSSWDSHFHNAGNGTGSVKSTASYHFLNTHNGSLKEYFGVTFGPKVNT
jgi:hypothetical protein